MYIQTLRRQGVEVVDALAAFRAYAAAGGQTFFKRDVHWTPDAANFIAREIAKTIRGAVTAPLPSKRIKVTRRRPDMPYYGRHINNWTKTFCGHFLPPEPLKNYVVTPDGADNVNAEVVKAGTSFSIPPYDVGFLSVWLQSPVYNAAIGGGGMLFPLETYLRGDVYKADRPAVIVWEYFVSADHVVRSQQRRLIAAIHGLCGPDLLAFEQSYNVEGSTPIRVEVPSVTSSEHYLTFQFSDPKVTKFDISLRYQHGEKEVLSINHPYPDNPAKNSGRYFTTLEEQACALGGLTIVPLDSARGRVTVQVCRTP